MISKKELENFTLPGWEQLPDIELYMDQVLSLIGKYFGSFSEEPENVTTASMINNYVKAKIVPPPKKKKYDREHLSYFMMIFVFKRVLTINQIGELFENLKKDMTVEEIYNAFKTEIERAFGYVCATLSGCDSQINSDGIPLMLKSAVDAYANVVMFEILLDMKKAENGDAESPADAG